MKLDIVLTNTSNRELDISCVRVPFSLMPSGHPKDTSVVHLEDIVNANDQRELRFIGEIEGYVNAGMVSVELDTDCSVKGAKKKASKRSSSKKSAAKQTATQKAADTLGSLQDGDSRPVQMLGKKGASKKSLPDASKAVKEPAEKENSLKKMI